MEIERSEMFSKGCKANMVNFMNLQSLTGIRDGFENGDIPEWLLMEILVRLSTKVVHRFKLVSKQWLSLISDPSFVRYYVSRASSLSQPWTFISRDMHRGGGKSFYFPEYELLEDIYSQVNYCKLSFPCTQQSYVGEIYMICGVSNGLVLYNSSYQSKTVLGYYICNPVTGQWIALPEFSWLLHKESCGFLTHVENGLLKSYRVVRHELTEYTVRRKKFLKFDVFFSEIGRWKKFIVSINQEEWQDIKGSTTVNGVMYWIVGIQGIIAYDPGQSPEEVHTIVFPVDIHDSTFDSKCGAYEGKLRYFKVCKSDGSFKIWVLNDYISGDWSLQHKISYMDIQCDANPSYDIPSFTPVSFHPFDLDVGQCIGLAEHENEKIRSRSREML